jgi:hypothetical protein
MPVDKPIEDKDAEEWISVGGKKIRIDAGADKEDITREKLPSARGEKQHNTKEAQKMYKMRFDLLKSVFHIRDEVVFAEYKKSGIISGINGEKLNILCEGRNYPIFKNHVFKKEELLHGVHWDSMTNVYRVGVLKAHNLPTFYNKQNWGNLAIEIRQELLKSVSPAGTTTSTTGVHNPIYNPINEEKTVTDRIADEIKRQHSDKGATDQTGSKDEKKGKD